MDTKQANDSFIKLYSRIHDSKNLDRASQSDWFIMTGKKLSWVLINARIQHVLRTSKSSTKCMSPACQEAFNAVTHMKQSFNYSKLLISATNNTSLYQIHWKITWNWEKMFCTTYLYPKSVFSECCRQRQSSLRYRVFTFPAWPAINQFPSSSKIFIFFVCEL